MFQEYDAEDERRRNVCCLGKRIVEKWRRRNVAGKLLETNLEPLATRVPRKISKMETDKDRD